MAEFFASIGEGLSQMGGAEAGTMNWGNLLQGVSKLNSALGSPQQQQQGNQLSDLTQANNIWSNINKKQTTPGDTSTTINPLVAVQNKYGFGNNMSDLMKNYNLQR